MSFILIRIIMSLFPFVKEALSDVKNKSKTYVVLVSLLLLLVVAFFLQADVIRSLFDRNKELRETLEIRTDELDAMSATLENIVGDYEKELAGMAAIVTTQNHLLSLCSNVTEEKENDTED